MSKSPFQGLVKANLPGMGGKGLKTAMSLAVVGVGASAIAYNSLFTGYNIFRCIVSYHSLCTPVFALSHEIRDGLVEGGQKAIIFSRFGGVLPKVYNEGLHFRMPWLHIPHVFNVRTRPTSIPSLTGSKGIVDLPLHRPIAQFPFLMFHRRFADGEHHAARADEAQVGEAARDLQEARH